MAVQSGGVETVGELSHGLHTGGSGGRGHQRPELVEPLVLPASGSREPEDEQHQRYRRHTELGLGGQRHPDGYDAHHERLDLRDPFSYRVSAYGSGTTYAAEWSKPSEALGAPTAECVAPVFDEESYEFDVRARAVVGTTVGTVSATDPNDDTVTYSITAGNGAGKFAIGRSTGGDHGDSAHHSPRRRDTRADPQHGGGAERELASEGLRSGRSGVLLHPCDDGRSKPGVQHGCTDQEKPVTVPEGATSHEAALTLHGCTVPGTTVTATLLEGTKTVGAASLDVTVEATSTEPSIQIWGLAPVLVQGQSDQFMAVASHLAPLTSFFVTLGTDNANLGFSDNCLIRGQEDLVNSSDPSHTMTRTLHGCAVPGGTMTAELIRGSSTVVDTATWDVQVVASPKDAPPGPTGVDASLASGGLHHRLGRGSWDHQLPGGASHWRGPA